MELINFSLITFLVIFIFMNLFYFVSLYLKKKDIADFAWGLGFVIVSIFNLILSDNFQKTKLILTSLIFLWGLRLATYIFIRNRGRKDDFRYANFKNSYFSVFILQGLLMFLVSLPATLYNRFDGGVAMISFVGLLVWVLGFYFETIGDIQMYIFKKNPANKGKVMDQGLWQYTRHPNYFGEVTMWWGIWLLTLGSTYWYIGIIGPLTITYLITKVSGIPLLEKKYEGNKEFEVYKKKTSVFFPWFTKG